MATVNPRDVAANSWVRWPRVRTCKSELGTSRSDRELSLDMMTRICRIGRKQLEAGKVGISPGSSTARYWSRSLSVGLGMNRSRAFGVFTFPI